MSCAASVLQPGGCAAAVERARGWLDRCEGARTPGLGALTGPHPLADLTPRERELAQLAVAASSRQIAERLTLSVRTVDNHLARVYQKLGVAGRAELAALLGRPETERA